MSKSEQWIVIPNWDKFQHYPDRTPPWIKTYTAELLNSEDYLKLSLADRGLLHGLWAHYALARGVVPSSTRHLSRILQSQIRRRQLERLNDAGFIAFVASKPLALTRSREQSRAEEKSLEEQGLISPTTRASEDPAPNNNHEDPATGPSPTDNDFAREFELAKLLPLLLDRDEGTLDVLRRAAEGLPIAVLVKVRESTLRNAGGAGYAINALRDERKARQR